jgi:hypothetical protein
MYQLKIESEHGIIEEVDFIVCSDHFVIYGEYFDDGLSYEIKTHFSLKDAKKIADFLNFAISQQE